MTERFELLEQVGRGAMGAVWKARDTETGEIVALKLLHSTHLGDDDYVERFEREVEVAQRIESTHVVKVLGYGRREGVPCVAMEFVEGRSLRDRIQKDGPLDWAEAKRIASQLAEGLSAAHAAGVIHRDIKPSNILVDGDGNVKLADFGIARAIDFTRMTGTAAVLGTPAYMAPDRGVTVQSDLYSFGCVLFEMLAGHAPFEAETSQQVMLMHLQDPPDLEALPREGQRLAGWLLEKDPVQRPANAQAVLAVLAGSATPPPPARTGQHRRRRAVLAPVFAVGALGAGLLVAALALPADDPDDPLPLPATAAPTAVPFEIRSVDCTPTTVDIGAEVTCSALLGGEAEGATWAWAADTGAPAQGAAETFTTAFTAEGERRRIVLTACDAQKKCVEKSAFVSVNDPAIGPPPEAAFTCAPNPVRAGETVVCSALAAGEGIVWTWDAPGAATTIGDGQSFSTSFASGRSNEVTLTVCRVVGEQRACGTGKQTILMLAEPTPTATQGTTAGPTSSGAATAPATPTLAPPAVSVACTPAAPRPGDQVSCTANVTGSVSSRTWIASGGSPASGSAATFATRFNAPGPKTILLEACNAGGCGTGSASVAVSDAEPPAVHLVCTPSVLQIGSPITCTASGAVDSWSWNAPAGNPSSGAGASFVTRYNTYGDKSLSVVGCAGTACATVSASFRVDPPWATPNPGEQQPGPASTSAPPTATQPAAATSTPVPGATATNTPTQTPTPLPGATNTPTPTTAPPTATPTPPVQIFNFPVWVSGTQAWTDTGFDLQDGDEIYILASGLVHVAGSDTEGKSPDGTGDGSLCAPPQAPFPNGPCWALVGRVGAGAPFFVGSEMEGVVTGSGRLLLGVNDYPHNDNSGGWSVDVFVARSSGGAGP